MSAINTTCKPYAPDAAANSLSVSSTQTITRNEQPRVAAKFAAAETARVRWYEAAIAAYEERERSLREEEEILMMRRPFTTEQAYARFGLLLGLLPPAAIFVRALYTIGYQSASNFYFLCTFCLVMNLLCALVGWRMGQSLGRKIFADAHTSWPMLGLKSVWAALLWGLATGAAGGVVCFGFGAIFGVLCALAVALPAFLVFAPLHHSLARGGMIDARHFWPVASGVTLNIVALILRLGS
jgi:hypothetical protein